MLAFDDQSLARLMRAAKAVPQRHRGKWLRRIAREVDPAPLTSNALVLRDARKRAKSGLGFYHLALDQVAVEEMLVREGLLPPHQDYSRKQVEAALTSFLVQLTDIHVG